MDNKSLFWYGFFAKIKTYLGSFIVGMGLLALVGGLTFKIILFDIGGIIILILGFILVGMGRSQRFDYKMQSGYIVHRGDQ